MNDHVQALLDKQSIYEILVTCCRGVERCDDDLIGSMSTVPERVVGSLSEGR